MNWQIKYRTLIYNYNKFDNILKTISFQKFEK